MRPEPLPEPTRSDRWLDATYGVIPPDAVQFLWNWAAEQHTQHGGTPEAYAVVDYLARHGGTAFRHGALDAMLARGLPMEGGDPRDWPSQYPERSTDA